MAELALGVASLVMAGAELAVKVYKFCQDFKECPSQIAEIGTTLELVSGILSELRVTIDSVQGARRAEFSRTTNELRIVFEKLKTLLTQYDGIGKRRNFILKRKWKDYGQAEAERLGKMVFRLKGILDTFLSLEHRSVNHNGHRGTA